MHGMNMGSELVCTVLKFVPAYPVGVPEPKAVTDGVGNFHLQLFRIVANGERIHFYERSRAAIHWKGTDSANTNRQIFVNNRNIVIDGRSGGRNINSAIGNIIPYGNAGLNVSQFSR